MLEKVLISIIMPVYNSEYYLVDCVSSILREEFESFELLLIDDGSTDSSPKLCDELAKTDNRIRVFHKGNGGICAARNFGLQHARGEYIAFSDHDDIVREGFLRQNYEYAVQTNSDIVKFGRESLIIKDDKIIKRDIRSFSKEILERDEIREKFLKLRFDGAMTCVWDGIFKRDFLVNNNIYFNTQYKKGGEDIAFCSQCFTNAERIAFNDGFYYTHYIRIGFSTSTKPDEQRLHKFRMLINNLDECIDKLGISREKNPFYYLNIMKELIYPSLVYYSCHHESINVVKDFLKDSALKYNIYASSTLTMIRINQKWGLWATLFKFRMYGLMYTIVRYKK